MPRTGPLHFPGHLGMDIGTSQRGIVQRRPAAGPHEKLLRRHPVLAPRVDHDPPRRLHIEAMAVTVPGGRHLAIRFRCLDDGRPHGITPGDQDATRFKESLSGISDRDQMLLVPRQDPAQVGDDDVGSLGKAHPSRPVLFEHDPIRVAIRRRHLPRDLDGVGWLDRVDATGTELTRQHREDARTRPNVEHDGARVDHLAKGLFVRIRSHPIGDHRTIGSDAIHPDLFKPRVINWLY